MISKEFTLEMMKKQTHNIGFWSQIMQGKKQLPLQNLYCVQAETKNELIREFSWTEKYFYQYVTMDLLYGCPEGHCQNEFTAYPEKENYQNTSYSTRSTDVFYFAKQMPKDDSYNLLKHLNQPVAEINYMLIPSFFYQINESIPMRIYSKNTVVGPKLYAVKDISNFEIGLMCSRMFRAWVVNYGESTCFPRGMATRFRMYLYKSFPMLDMDRRSVYAISKIGKNIKLYWSRHAMNGVEMVQPEIISNTIKNLYEELNHEIDKSYGGMFYSDEERVEVLTSKFLCWI